MQNDYYRPQDDHDADAEASSGDITNADDNDHAQVLAEALGKDPDAAFAGLAEATADTSSVTSKKACKKPFGFGPRCEAVLEIGYFLAWITFGVGCLAVVYGLMEALNHPGHIGDKDIIIVLMGLLGVLNCFVWIIVLARATHILNPAQLTSHIHSLIAQANSNSQTAESDWPELHYNDPADVAAELGGQTQGDNHG